MADTDNDRVVMMNVAGQVLGSLPLQKPIAIAQDFKLNLFVCAEFDTLGENFQRGLQDRYVCSGKPDISGGSCPITAPAF